ncbi:hypothetical protein LCGC14_0516030, partial [marine sediment metagenome]
MCPEIFIVRFVEGITKAVKATDHAAVATDFFRLADRIEVGDLRGSAAITA